VYNTQSDYKFAKYQVSILGHLIIHHLILIFLLLSQIFKLGLKSCADEVFTHLSP
jgi:hypothetical protein